MANVINLNITPLYPVQTDAYTLSSPAFDSNPGRPPLSRPSKKRLRSCLSPARSRPTTPSPFEDPLDPCSGYTSRSASYGSERSKSVRWEGEVPVTSYFDTYSCEEYDRTPLEAPSAEERACVLPARNSRCMTRSYQRYLADEIDERISPSPIHESPLSSPALAALDAALTSIVEVPCESLDSDEDDDDDFETEHHEDVDEDDDEEEDDRQWEQCMDRRRMLFASMCKQDDKDVHPQFDGYRSLSSTLANILRSVGCDEEPPVPGSCSIEAAISSESLQLGQRQPDTPSLTSGSSDYSEAETLVKSV